MRRLLAFPVLVLAILLLGAANAAACVTDDWLRLDGGSAAPGAVVGVEGGGFEPGAVELRWNGMQGEPLGSAQAGADGRFASEVTVPAGALAGSYSVVAVQEGGEGTRGWAYADLAVPGPPVPPTPDRSGVLPDLVVLASLGVALLAVATAAGVGVSARRQRLAEEERLRAELDRLLEEADLPTDVQ